MYVYQSGLIDFLSILLIGYLIYLGVSNFLMKQEIKRQDAKIANLNRKLMLLKKKIDKKSDDEDFEDYDFMNERVD